MLKFFKLWISLILFCLIVNFGYGQGSYSTTVPGNIALPPAPSKTANITGPVLTTDWSANLAFNQDNSTQPLIADPLAFVCNSTGVIMGTMGANFAAGTAFFSARSQDLTVSPISMTATRPLMDKYTDWSATASWNNGAFKADMAHGSPFAYFTSNNGIRVVTASAPTVYYNSANVIGVTVGGRSYGLYAPTGATWTVSGSTIQSTLNGQNYVSIATLPNNAAATVTYFQNFAYNFITNTTATWVYDQATSTLRTTYTAAFVKKQATGSNNMIYALYPHQWLHYTGALTPHTYHSVKGLMKTVEAPSFTTSIPFTGILPHLPLVAQEGVSGYSSAALRQFIMDEANKTDVALIASGGETYGTGVQLGRTGQLVRIAHQLGMTAQRDRFLNVIKTRLQGWLTYTSGESSEYFYYDARWGTLIGVNASYGSDRNLNDHHFHYGYYIMAAATVAQFDAAWANTWAPMVEMLIRDANSWMRNDTMFPFMRGLDIYAGHSWASGDAEFADGNNQESSSEAINCAAGIALWGMARGNNTIRDAGIFLYTQEKVAQLNYWFDVNKVSFPANYAHSNVGMVWGAKADYATWFGGLPNNSEYILGINILPVTAASLHLGHYPAEVLQSYNEVNARGLDEWQDVLWEYLALADPAQALARIQGNPNYAMAGSPTNDSKAHTYHWIHNLNTLGQVQQNITANTPSYAVFLKNGVKNYVAYNSTGAAITVTFSDGKTMSVPAGQLASSVGGGTPSGATIPGKIEAENYAAMFGVQTETTTDTGGGLNVGWIEANDWMDYAVNVTTAGTYRVDFRVASTAATGQIQLRRGTTTLATVNVPNTGGWQVWTTVSANVTLSAGAQTLRLHASAAPFNVNWMQFSTTGTPPPPSPNLALNRPVTVSTTENATTPGSGAVDGNLATRWSSAFADPQWIYVDLGATYNVNRVKVTWEAAYGRDYTVQISGNASTWTTLKTITGNTALVNDHTGLAGSGRYVRINGTARGTVYGYSIFELEVYGSSAARIAPLETESPMVFPIPAQKTLYISNVTEGTKARVINIVTGKIVLEAAVRNNTIGVENLKTGQYIIEIQSGNRLIKKRFQKE